MVRRLRATFLLRCVTLAASVGVFYLVLKLTMAGGLMIAVAVCLVFFWFLGIEAQLLPLLIEHFAAKRSGRSDEPVSSLWFVDLNEQRKRRLDRHFDATRDNPTLR